MQFFTEHPEYLLGAIFTIALIVFLLVLCWACCIVAKKSEEREEGIIKKEFPNIKFKED